MELSTAKSLAEKSFQSIANVGRDQFIIIDSDTLMLIFCWVSLSKWSMIKLRKL